MNLGCELGKDVMSSIYQEVVLCAFHGKIHFTTIFQEGVKISTTSVRSVR